MIKIIRKKYKILLSFILGILVVGIISTSATTVILGRNVDFTSTTDLISSNVQDAIDEVYTKSDIRKSSNFVEAYTYNQTSGAVNYCITGNEDTCEVSECYKDKTTGKCNAGDIIRYKVNTQDVVTFHVMYNDKDTITMQSQRNTIYNTAWITALDYSGSTTYKNDKGPLTALNALESATAGWSNVEDQTYSIGDENATLGYSGCSAYNSCSDAKYALSRTAKSRMITAQEATNLGCSDQSKSCAYWMNNYLLLSNLFGGTYSDDSTANGCQNNYGYWTLSSNSSTNYAAWFVNRNGNIYYSNEINCSVGARAVVVVNK